MDRANPRCPKTRSMDQTEPGHDSMLIKVLPFLHEGASEGRDRNSRNVRKVLMSEVRRKNA